MPGLAVFPWEHDRIIEVKDALKHHPVTSNLSDTEIQIKLTACVHCLLGVLSIGFLNIILTTDLKRVDTGMLANTVLGFYPGNREKYLIVPVSSTDKSQVLAALTAYPSKSDAQVSDEKMAFLLWVANLPAILYPGKITQRNSNAWEVLSFHNVNGSFELKNISFQELSSFSVVIRQELDELWLRHVVKHDLWMRYITAASPSAEPKV